MNQEKQLLVHKYTGARRHYLILAEDRRGKSWNIPSYKGDISLERFLQEELNIPPEEVREIEEDENLGKITVEVFPDTRVTIKSDNNKGGIFIKGKEAKQLLNSRDHMESIEKHGRALKSS